MEVVPTNDGDDDGTIWFRCPRCQGFLPKLKEALEKEEPAPEPEPDVDETLLYDSPAAMMESRRARESVDSVPVLDDDDILVGEVPAPSMEPDDDLPVDTPAEDDATREGAEPVAEYAAMLADLNVDQAAPYRPWETYEVGECVNHLAWNDCGVVVAKEELPGGRKIIKCYFEEAGVVRLIEQAAR